MDNLLGEDVRLQNKIVLILFKILDERAQFELFLFFSKDSAKRAINIIAAPK